MKKVKKKKKKKHIENGQQFYITCTDVCINLWTYVSDKKKKKKCTSSEIKFEKKHTETIANNMIV